MWIISWLIQAVIFGFATQIVAKRKGYTDGFAWGFFLGIFGMLVMRSRANKSTEEYEKVVDTFDFVSSGSAKIAPNCGAIPLYEQPGDGLLAWVPSNTEIQVIDEVHSNGKVWMKVRYENYTGHVEKENLIAVKILEIEK